MPKLNLQKREKTLLLIGALVIVPALLYSFAQKPLKLYRQASASVLNARQYVEEARSVRDAVEEERQTASAMRDLLVRVNAVNLVTLVSRHLREMDLQQSGRATFQSQSTFANQKDFEQLRVDLNGVSLEELVDFLHRIYSAGNIVVTHSAEIQPMETGQGLKCTLVLMSPRP